MGCKPFSYSIDKKEYIISPTENSYKVLSLPELKIMFLSPTFQLKIDFIFSYNEFVTLNQGSKFIKMRFGHKVQEYQFDFEFQEIISLGKILLILSKSNKLVVFHSGDFKVIEEH